MDPAHAFDALVAALHTLEWPTQVDTKAEVFVDLERLTAGPYTRPRLSSTGAVSDTRKHPTDLEHLLAPPLHESHNPYAHPLCHTKRSS